MTTSIEKIREPLRHKLAIGPNGCWLWRGALTRGYGRAYVNGNKSKSAAKAVWESEYGPLPPKLELDHYRLNEHLIAGESFLCSTACVNPSHLRPITHQQNMQAAFLRKTYCVRGHRYSDATTIFAANGTRKCRTCKRSDDMKSYRKKPRSERWTLQRRAANARYRAKRRAERILAEVAE